MTVVEEKRSYVVTAQAGRLIAGRPHGGVGSTVELTVAEARYELMLEAIVPEGVPVVVPPPLGPVSPIDRISALRGTRDYDFTVGELAEYLGETDLIDAFQRAVLGDVAPDRNTLAKLSAALDAAVALLRAAIQTRASESALAGKAASGANGDITSLTGLTTPLSLAQGGTGGRSAAEVRAAIGLPLVPGDAGLATVMEALYGAWIDTLPMWSGDGPIPVPAGKYFRQGPGGPPLKAQ